MKKEQLEEFFIFNFENLSARSRNILENYQLHTFDLFIKIFIIEKREVNVRHFRNCGVKSEIEINEFIKLIIKCIENSSYYFESFNEVINNNYENTESKIIDNREYIIKVNSSEFLLFNKYYEKLNKRTKNVLLNIGANTFKNFVNIVINDPHLHKNKIQNCGAKTFSEILELKRLVNRIIKKDINEYEKDDFINKTPIIEYDNNILFSMLDLQIKESTIFKQRDKDILFHYFNIIKNTNHLTLSDIGRNNNLSRERIRQISKNLPKKLKQIIRITLINLEVDFRDYFKDNYFYVDESLTERINNEEKTNFNSNFITFVLNNLNNEAYNFLLVESKFEKYFGFFINNEISFDVKGIYNYLKNYFNIIRQNDIKIESDSLIKRFKKNKLDNANLDYISEKEIVEFNNIVNLFAKYYSNNINEVDINRDYLIIKRNTKKQLCEYLVDILNEKKNPLHYSDLYSEIIKRNIKVTSENSIHSILVNNNKIFGLKGPGIYGLKEWGGYFGKIGDVAEQILLKHNKPIERGELKEILSRELYISKDSINTVLFSYELEDRFILIRNNKIALKKWVQK